MKQRTGRDESKEALVRELHRMYALHAEKCAVIERLRTAELHLIGQHHAELQRLRGAGQA